MKLLMTMTAKNGMARETVGVMKAAMDYVSGKYDMKGELYIQAFGGTAGTIYLIGEYKDLATAQALQAKLMADEKYWEYVKKMAEFVIAPPTIALLQPL